VEYLLEEWAWKPGFQARDRFHGFLFSNLKDKAMQEAPHIGHLIEAELKRQGRSVVWLAEQLCCHRNNVYLIFRREWIDTSVLKKIALALRHDFFADLSDDFRNTMAGDRDLFENAK